jgi:thioredoxin-like negative regulator of GroEL
METKPQKYIITEIPSREAFFQLLQANPGIIILKLGAEWCKPCQKIKPFVENFFLSTPENVLCGDINVDYSADVYAMLKSKKMVNGIPVMLCYKKGNTTFVPNLSVTGIDPTSINNFFHNCGVLYNEVKAESTK